MKPGKIIDVRTRMRCSAHPRYQGKRHPRGNCYACWVFYFAKQRPPTLVAEFEFLPLKELFMRFQSGTARQREQCFFRFWEAAKREKAALRVFRYGLETMRYK